MLICPYLCHLISNLSEYNFLLQLLTYFAAQDPAGSDESQSLSRTSHLESERVKFCIIIADVNLLIKIKIKIVLDQIKIETVEVEQYC